MPKHPADNTADQTDSKTAVGDTGSDHGADQPPMPRDGTPPPSADPLVLQILSELFSQQSHLQQHLTELHRTVVHEGQSWRDGAALLRSELQKFQTGGPQRAMSSLYHKIFREFIGHLNHLDELVTAGGNGTRSAAEQAWIDSIRLLRDQFESLLGEWGVRPIAIEVGVDQFDPEIHEAVTVIEPEVLPDGPENVVVKIRRRGWKIQDSILQFPQVLAR